MDCGELRKDLDAYLDDMVSPGDRAAIEAHLAACPECTKALAELQHTVQLLKNLEEVTPPAWLTQKVMTRIRAEQAPPQGFLSRLFSWIPVNRPAAAVATLLIAVTAVILMKNMEPEVRETLSTPATEQPRSISPAEMPGQTVPEKEEKTAGSSQGQTLGKDEVGQRPSPKALPVETPEKTPESRPAVAEAPAVVEGDLKEKSFNAPLKKAATPGKDIPADRSAENRENRTLTQTTPQAPAGMLRTAPAAPAAAPASRPALTLPEQTAARSRAAAKDSLQGEQGQSRSKVREEKAAGPRAQQRIVTERYAGGSPRVVITYRNAAETTGKLIEERFDEQGRRHGLHRAYDAAGALTAEVIYEHGGPVSVREFNADGTLKTGGQSNNWPWLTPALP